MQNKYAYLGLGLAFVGGAALGVAAGYHYSFQKYADDFNEAVAREVQETKEFYANLHKREYATPEEAAKDLIPEDVKDAAEALLTYQGKEFVKPEEDDEPDEQEILERNVFENGDEPKVDWDNRDKTKPYVVTLEEYMDVPDEYEDIQLTYYAGDGVLVDDADEVLDDIEAIVGNMNIMMFGASDPDQPHILLIRNPKLKSNIEISESMGKYAHEVLGLQHSDEPMRRRTRRWDDE